MIYTFQTESDGQLWVLDIVKMTWGKASTIAAAVSLGAVENKLANYIFSDEGKIVSVGAGTFNMEGRKPTDGLTTIGILSVPYEDHLVLFLRANVRLKEDSFKSNFPEFMQKGIIHRVKQPETKG